MKKIKYTDEEVRLITDTLVANFYSEHPYGTTADLLRYAAERVRKSMVTATPASQVRIAAVLRKHGL
jgi:hypothetical protein